MKQYILAIDQGTSSTKSLLFDEEGKAVAKGSEPLQSYFPQGGYVEQDPEEIYRNVLASVQKCMDDFTSTGGDPDAISACGISNQRETFVVWDEAGKPLYNAIVWQCKRSVQVCARLKSNGWEEEVKNKTGLIIDPYFSGTKLIWLYENDDAVRQAINNGKAYFGTIDTWLLYKLTSGASYFTDYTNASRTLFFNLAGLHWDHELLAKYGLSNINLPACTASAADFGQSDFNGICKKPIAITGMMGDSHAAAFGEGCFSPGTAKATLGTGCSILMNIGSQVRHSSHGMVTTICWSTGERVDYAFEGIIVSCGATMEWLKNNLGLFADSRQTESMATAVPDNNGVYLVPAFSGLGAPHWNMTGKAVITGLTFDCNKNHLVRAALESIPYQIKDVLVAMEQDAGMGLEELMVDGGISANRFVVQFLSDLLQRNIVHLGMPDVSAMGAAYMAGIRAGIFKDLAHLRLLNTGKTFTFPRQHLPIQKYYEGWQAAVENL